jgi:hypothetical protein
MNVGTGRQNIIFLFWIEQFPFWECINRNQTFTVYRILIDPSFAVNHTHNKVCKIRFMHWSVPLCTLQLAVDF